MSDLRNAARQALDVLETTISSHGNMARSAITALRAALEQPEPTCKELLQVESAGRGQIATPLVLPTEVASELTTTDLAWLETRRLVRVWKELGQMRWMGADEGWDKAVEAVRARLDKECQDVLAWKEQADASGETAKQVLQRMRGLKGTHPPRREWRGLTEEETKTLWDANGYKSAMCKPFVRAIEAALKEKNYE